MNGSQERWQRLQRLLLQRQLRQLHERRSRAAAAERLCLQADEQLSAQLRQLEKTTAGLGRGEAWLQKMNLQHGHSLRLQIADSEHQLHQKRLQADQARQQLVAAITSLARQNGRLQALDGILSRRRRRALEAVETRAEQDSLGIALHRQHSR